MDEQEFNKLCNEGWHMATMVTIVTPDARFDEWTMRSFSFKSHAARLSEISDYLTECNGVLLSFHEIWVFDPIPF